MTLRVSFSSSRHINVCLNGIRLALFAPQYASLFARCKSLLKKVLSFLQFVRYQFKSCLRAILRTIACSRGVTISLVVSVFWLCNLVGWQALTLPFLKSFSVSQNALQETLFSFHRFLWRGTEDPNLSASRTLRFCLLPLLFFAFSLYFFLD